MTTAATPTQVAANGLTFDTLAAGPDDGERVLLLHGFPQPASCWRPQLAALANAGLRAIAPNQRGYSAGARPRDRGAYTLDHLVADALAIVGDRPFHLVGHDWGGAVAWALASAHADSVRSLTVVSTPHPRAMLDVLLKGQALRSWYIGLFRIPGLAEAVLGGRGHTVLRTALGRSGLSADDVRDVLDVMRQPGALTAALNWYRANGPSQVRKIGRVTVPTLYVWSTNDPALGRSAAEATRDYVTGPYRFEVLDGVGHWVMQQAPEDLSRLLLAQIRAV